MFFWFFIKWPVRNSFLNRVNCFHCWYSFFWKPSFDKFFPNNTYLGIHCFHEKDKDTAKLLSLSKEDNKIYWILKYTLDYVSETKVALNGHFIRTNDQPCTYCITDTYFTNQNKFLETRNIYIDRFTLRWRNTISEYSQVRDNEFKKCEVISKEQMIEKGKDLSKKIQNNEIEINKRRKINLKDRII